MQQRKQILPKNIPRANQKFTEGRVQSCSQWKTVLFLQFHFCPVYEPPFSVPTDRAFDHTMHILKLIITFSSIFGQTFFYCAFKNN